MTGSTCFLAAIAQPLFGNIWLALALVLAVVALVLALVALVGRRLAATHPDPVMPLQPAAVAQALAPVASSTIGASQVEPVPTEVRAVIAAVVAVTFGRSARVGSVEAARPAPSVEVLMQQWSMEGRRQIYSSHQIR